MPKYVTRYDEDLTVKLKVNSSVTVAEGDLVGANSSGEAVLADKDTGTNVEAIGVAVRDADGTATGGAWVAVTPFAVVEGFSALTAGAQCYLSGTAGGVTQTRPTTAGDTIQAVGMAVSATKVVFNVAAPAIVAQASGSTTIG